MKPGTSVCARLSFAPLLCGCSHQQALTKDEVASIEERIVFCLTDSSYVKSAPSDEPVYFYLKDGSHVESEADYHRRVKDGFQVWGSFFKKGNAKEKWGGVIRDSAIQAIAPAAIDSVGAVFYLNDGTFVESHTRQHTRIETGYRVSGDRYTKIVGEGGNVEWREGSFSGVIEDSDIREIAVPKTSAVLAVTYYILVVGAVLGVILIGIPLYSLAH